MSLPSGIRSRHISNSNSLDMHILEAGYAQPKRPLILMLHGFPELAYSWRKVMLPIAEAGYYVVAPDQRGYGKTSGSDNSFHADLQPFRILNLVKDILGLVWSLGYSKAASVIGHDFGSPEAGTCSLVRPDVFQSVVMMSAPFSGAGIVSNSDDANQQNCSSKDKSDIHQELSMLTPPRKHYQWYYSSEEANENMLHCK